MTLHFVHLHHFVSSLSHEALISPSPASRFSIASNSCKYDDYPTGLSMTSGGHDLFRRRVIFVESRNFE